jgi:transcriptional regulator with XRE-family HTH domain
MTLGEAFSIRLNKLLAERKISLYKFLKDNCIARSTIINIQKGNTKSPTLATVYEVADGLNMTPIEFLDNPIFKREDLEYM